MTTKVDELIATASTSSISNTGMWGGSAAAFFGWLGSQDVVAGIGAIAVILGLILNYWHKRAMQRIEIAKLTPEQRKTFHGEKK